MTDSSSGESTAIRIKGLVQSLIPIILVGVILFVSSGRLDWIMAWALLGVHLFGTALVVFSVNPSLVEERSQGNRPGTKKWDSILMSLINIIGLVALLVAGLDMRFNWPGPVPPAVEAGALALLIPGFGLIDWAMVSNIFFSTRVRIQGDRGHTIATGGPYRYLRHPGYVGLIVCVIAQPLMLGSLWALIPAAITVVLFIVRTGIEDRTLQEELAGYKEYARRVRYRLVPGVW